jgi:hypothetical protein
VDVQVAGMAVAAVSLVVVAESPTLAMTAPALITLGFGRGFYDCNVMPVLARVATPRLRASGYGILNLAGCLAGGAAAALAGCFKPVIGIGGTIFVVAALLLIAGVALAAMRRRMGSPPAV